MQVVTARARNALTAMIITTFVGSLGAIMFIPYPTENNRLLYFMLGQLTGFVGTIVNYHFLREGPQLHKGTAAPHETDDMDDKDDTSPKEEI
jgi:hypothetical protein